MRIPKAEISLVGGVLVFGLFYGIFVYNPGCRSDMSEGYKDLFELEVSNSLRSHVKEHGQLPISEEELIASASSSYHRFEDMIFGGRLNYHSVSSQSGVVWSNGYDKDDDHGKKSFNPAMEEFPIVLWEESEAGPEIVSVTPYSGEGSLTPEDIDGDLVVQVSLKKGNFDPEDFLEFEWFDTGPVDWDSLIKK